MATRNRLSAFREAVRCHRRCRTEAETPTNSPGLDYMMALKRCQAAFGIPLDRDDFRPTREQWAFWRRLHAAIVRWSERDAPGGETPATNTDDVDG